MSESEEEDVVEISTTFLSEEGEEVEMVEKVEEQEGKENFHGFGFGDKATVLTVFKLLKIQRVVRNLESQVEQEEKDLSEELDRLYLEAKLKAIEENTEKAGEENGKGEQTSVKELEEKLDQLLAKLDGDLSKKLMADWNGFKENIEKAGGGDEELEGMLDEQLAKLDEEARGDISPSKE